MRRAYDAAAVTGRVQVQEIITLTAGEKTTMLKRLSGAAD
jgi:hypothetical protein